MAKRSTDPKRSRRVSSNFNPNLRTVQAPPDFTLIRSVDNTPPAEKIKAAVLAAILLGQPVAAIAARYGLEYATVNNWKKAFEVQDAVNLSLQLSDSLMVFIQQEIQNLISIAVTTSDEEWIKDQTASELADYINVKNNTLLKVLEAFGKAQAGANEHKIHQITNDIEVMKEAGMNDEEILGVMRKADL